MASWCTGANQVNGGQLVRASCPSSPPCIPTMYMYMYIVAALQALHVHVRVANTTSQMNTLYM